MNQSIRVLMVEDDKNLGFILQDFLGISGYDVTWAEDGESGLRQFLQGAFDLCLLDIMLPKMDGFSLAKNIREHDEWMPIIFLTARDQKEDRLKGFRTGADDYITKPFSTEELNMRIAALMRRVKGKNNNTSDQYPIGKFILDYTNQVIHTPQGEKKLTRKESELLMILSKNLNTVVRRDDILKTIWGEVDYFMGRSMDVYITKLRKLLREDPAVSITNIHKTGFKLEVHA
jgi:two-component system, OmpR family, response regulator